MLRDKLRMGFLKPGEVQFIDRNAFAATGPVFADVWASSETDPTATVSKTSTVTPSS